MADDELEQRVEDLKRDHRLTRWYTGRIDRDLAEIATTQTEHTDALSKIGGLLHEHTNRFQMVDSRFQEVDARFDSVDSQLRSLTQLVGQVLERLPDPGSDGGSAGGSNGGSDRGTD